MTSRRLCTDLSTGIGSNPGGKNPLSAKWLSIHGRRVRRVISSINSAAYRPRLFKGEMLK
jgi:hypothetical protein